MARTTHHANGISARAIRKNSSDDELLTLQQFLDEIQVSVSTYYDWRKKGTAPPSIKLPNGSIRVRRSVANAWIADHEEVSAS